MKAIVLCAILLIAGLSAGPLVLRAQHKDLKIALIRHAEKPQSGDNLDCRGFNRSS